jgi:pimeloyl-ACP methyl ester carboxylesterase
MTALVDPPLPPTDLRAAVLDSFRELPGRYVRPHAPRRARRYRLAVDGAPSHVVVADADGCSVYPSSSGAVDVELRTDPVTWLGIAEGAGDAVEAFLAGRLSLHGDLNEALRLDTLFLAPDGSPRSLAPARTRRVAVGRASLSVHETGPLGAARVLMVHGLGASKVSLLPAIAGLARDHRVVAVDLPGFGKSTAPLGAPYDAPWFAASLLGLLDALEIDRTAIVGNSLGGRVALEMAFAAPDRVRALGLLCPALAFDAYALLRPFLSVTRADVPLGIARWPIPRRLVDQGLRQLFADPTRVPAANLRAAREDFLRSIRPPARRMAFLATARHLGLEAPRRYWPRLADLGPPSLWIFGDTDRLVPGRYAEVVRRNAPGNARVECWRSTGHVPQFEHPERTVDALRGFLAAV